MLIVMLVALLCQGAPAAVGARHGTVIDARTRSGIAGARVTVAGERGAARTDASGRFVWTAALPPTPFTIVVILPDGNAVRPIRLDEWPRGRDLVLATEPAFAEGVTVSGIAPTIDTALNTSTTLLPRADLQLRHPATLTQALENIPGVAAISDGGEGAVPAIRGLARGRSLILVDGSRVSTERRAGPNASFLDPADIESVEIARGPASVAYGSDAFGGVIAARTRRGGYRAPLRVRVSGTAGAGIPERRGDIELSRGFGSDAVLMTAHARQFEDYRAPAGVVANSGWQDGGINARWDHGNSATRAWSLGWQTGLGRQIGRPRSDSAAIVATTPYEDSHRLTASYDAAVAGWFRHVRLDGLLGAARERTQQDRLPTSRQPRNLTQADTSYRDAEMRVTADRQAGPVSVQTGADVQGRYGLQSDDITTAYGPAETIASIDTNPSIASAHRTGLGVFAQTAAQVTDRVRLAAGVRGDSVRSANAGGYFGDRRTINSAAAGVAGVTISVTSRSTITAQIARGFRDPTLTERFYRGPVGRGFIQGNPDLQPETSRQFDLTGRWEFSRLQFSGAFYDYRIENLVERYVINDTSFFYRNRGSAQLRGAEVEAQAGLFPGLAIDLSAQMSRGRDASSGEPLDDVAPRTVSVVLRQTTRSRVGSYLRAAAIARHASAGPSEVPTPGYVAIDAGTVWRSSSHLEVRGVIRNALDRQWYSNAGPRWVYAPGRNGSVTFAVSF